MEEVEDVIDDALNEPSEATKSWNGYLIQSPSRKQAVDMGERSDIQVPEDWYLYCRQTS